MPFCTQCGQTIGETANFCSSCGARQSTAAAAQQGFNARKCPFCKQTVDSSASRCPHCSGEIGRLQDCVRCPQCSEMVMPIRFTVTNEKGFGTNAAKVILAGSRFLSSTEETYLGCPVCKTPSAFCSRCRAFTLSRLYRKWVGLGRAKSGYQIGVSCATCGRVIE